MSGITKFLIWLSPRKLFIKTQINIEKSWLGSDYGGFYVHLNALNVNSKVLSFGVGEDISFDLSLIQAKGLSVHTFDPTPRVSDFIQPHLWINEKLSFSNYGLGTEDGEVLFYPPENSNHISCSVVPNEHTKEKAYKVQMKKLPSILKEKNINEVDLLKLDIEGAEYDVIPDILKEGIRIKQFQLEIHPDLFPDGRLKTKKLIRLLNKAGYKIFGVSDTCRELSFINTNVL
jgi:FkbM family methyltransferase